MPLSIAGRAIALTKFRVLVSVVVLMGVVIVVVIMVVARVATAAVASVATVTVTATALAVGSGINRFVGILFCIRSFAKTLTRRSAACVSFVLHLCLDCLSIISRGSASGRDVLLRVRR